ncbi:YdhR family protein [Flavobacteriaceae bacterium]|nr:YdhR family protein [Flavobacteriaceae bacterium]
MKKNKYIILLLIAGAALYYMWTSSVPVEAVDKKNPAVLVVNFNLQDMSIEEYEALGTAVVPEFAPGKIDGLIGKTFIGNVEEGVFGGVYHFTSTEAVDTYLSSELWKGIKGNPNLVNAATDIYEVAAISELSNGGLKAHNKDEKVLMSEGLSVLVVNFNLQDMSLEQYATLGTAVVPEFAPGKIDGLIGKTFIGNVEEGVFGGVYYFTTNETMSSYLESDLWKGIEANENLLNFTKDTFSVASISELSNGIPNIAVPEMHSHD